MLPKIKELDLTLHDGSKAKLSLIPERDGSLEIITPAEAKEWCEAEIQLMEGCAYEYSIPGFQLGDNYGVVNRSALNSYSGRLTPKNYVGTMLIDIFKEHSGMVCGKLKLEIRSLKLGYRDHYRQMLGEIADECNELLLQANTPITQNISPLFSGDAQTLYQRFAFLKSVLDSQEFSDAVNKIISSPVSSFSETEDFIDIRNVKRLTRNMMKQFISRENRIPLPDNNRLYYLMPTIPRQVSSSRKTPSLNTPENRFIKHALNTFLQVCGDVLARSEAGSRLRDEARALVDRLELYLGNTLFRELPRPGMIPLNSPILQRKEGYREVFRVWLMYDLASRIVWDGGEDVYSGGKKDVAVLYEYWVYFQLLSIVREVFRVEPDDISRLITDSGNGLNLGLKQGIHIPLKGIYETASRRLRVQFSYNRQFNSDSDYPSGGSWTRAFRPDYTLSVWPDGIDIDLAETEETIVHIHFDAKYKVKDLKDIIGDSEPGGDNLQINPKEIDLLKMHAYRDAIRRTGGAYVIYPGTETLKKRGFHEIIPGLGAFCLNPGYNRDDGKAIEKFLSDVAMHLLDRASQREKIALKQYQVYKDKESESVYAPMPVLTGDNRDQIPDETYVLVAWYNGFEHWKWIEQTKLYNARTGLQRGSIPISPQMSGVKYILLHGKNESVTGKIFPLKPEGPKIWSADDLIQTKYPGQPSVPFYLVFSLLDNLQVPEFQNLTWDVSKLGNYTGYRGSALPFVVSLSELMKARVVEF